MTPNEPAPPSAPPESPGPPPGPANPPSDPASPDARRRPRAGTTALIACAAVLGVLTGTCAAYTVQSERPPTPLPPLSQAKLPYPEPLAEGKGPAPLSAARDRLVRTDGDLRKLLLRKPKGAEEARFARARNGWIDPYGYARGFETPDLMLRDLLQQELRRVASTEWEQNGSRFVAITLVQFRDEQVAASPDFLAGQQLYMPRAEHAGNAGKPLPGLGDGRFYVFDKPFSEAGYLPMYTARAVARRGDVVMDLWIHDAEPISESAVSSLARKQMERL
ncbi:hypothetical protein [Streptomyces meridianus]|uniref:Uncharacterized protein n=1 Tax=Streptomyces meridianus TaxID=2938945 RepID=A0ABT0X438_9ACTN|nr:hypothetical protein [Streptomyces meridianus]MCM2577306.1 hypothetical protein [Streptomyces meridianus]